MSAPPKTNMLPLRSVGGIRMGHITGIDAARELLIVLDETRGDAVRARSLVALTPEDLERAIQQQQPAAFLFEDGDLTRPLLVGLIQPIPSSTSVQESEAARSVAPAPSEAAIAGDELLATVDAATVDAATTDAAPVEGAQTEKVSLPSENSPLELRIDGQRLLLEAREELELRCGDASLTLRRDGLVIVRGTDIVSHAKARNRIRGASVQIN